MQRGLYKDLKRPWPRGVKELGFTSEATCYQTCLTACGDAHAVNTMDTMRMQAMDSV
jgi:hypothetical protein